MKALVLSLLLVGLCGCSLSRQAMATLHSTANFVALGADRRILIEPGAEGLGQEVAGYLAEAITQVEREHHRPFPQPVEVYLCASKESFSRCTGLPPVIKGAITIRHLFLSGERLRELPISLRRAVLTHELSHLHLQQYLGAYRYGATLPAWFQEGLAEYVSGGAAMEEVSVTEAEQAILAGTHLRPDTTGSFLFPRRWGAFGLKPQMFYRQSFMYLSYLKLRDESKFHAFMLALERGDRFDDAFISIFGLTGDTSWEQFVGTLAARR